MDPIISPIILYSGLALGAIGVAVAMPRKGLNPQILGALLAGIAVGGVLLALAITSFRAGLQPASLFFYVFAFIGLGAALRVITHPRPVYAALYFVLTILSSAGLFLLLAAEFMTFALIIIYAGAILITYLFVIMLATQAPTEDAVDMLSEYDARSREPVVSTVVGFALLAAMVGMMSLGVPQLSEPAADAGPRRGLDRMPGVVQTFLDDLGIARDVMPAASITEQPPSPTRDTPEEQAERMRAAVNEWIATHSMYNIAPSRDADFAGTIVLVFRDAEEAQRRLEAAQAMERGESMEAFADVRPLPDRVYELLRIKAVFANPDTGVGMATMTLPKELAPGNIASVGLALVGEHPLSLELAGVILLLAMLGAVVLARKQTEIEEERKATEAERLGLGAQGGGA